MSGNLRNSSRLLIPILLGIACIVLDAAIIQQHWRSLPPRERDMLLLPAVILTITQVARIYGLRDSLRQLHGVTQKDLSSTRDRVIGTTDSLAIQVLSVSFVVEMLLVAMIGRLL
jgi:hypothetical protein